MMNVGVEPQFSIKMYSKILNSFTTFQRSITNRVDKGYSPFFNYSPMYQLKSRATVILLSLFNIM
jgi:hypothetical protein